MEMHNIPGSNVFAYSTRFGTLIAESTDNGVKVSFDAGGRMVDVTETDNSKRTHGEWMITVGSRPPHKGDELTQNGHTFEVRDVRMENDGTYSVLPDTTDTWEKWEEQ